jgi:hypothetical protein
VETLTPVQRVAAIAIGLALTALVAAFFIPWAWKQLSDWLPAGGIRVPAPAPVPLPVERGPAGLFQDQLHPVAGMQWMQRAGLALPDLASAVDVTAA